MAADANDQRTVHQASYLAEVSRLAVDLADAVSEAQLIPLIAGRLREVTGALAVSFSTFDEERRSLRLVAFETESSFLTYVQRLLGRVLLGSDMPVPPDVHARMLREIVARVPDLTTLTFGMVPPLIGTTIERVLNIGDKLVLIFQREGRLVGTSSIILPKGREPVPDDVLSLFSNVVSAAVPRHRAEQALKESEERFKAIFDTASDGIFIHAVDTGEIVDVNRTGQEMFGYSRADILRLDVGQLSAQASDYTQQRALTLIRRAAAGAPQLFEWHCRRSDGALFWAEVKMRRTTLGAIDRVLVLVRDITQRKEAEEARSRLEDEVRQAQKMESIGRLAGGVAHDFNNLLTAILGNLTLVREDLGPGHPATDRLQEIGKAAEAAAGLTRQLLTFSRKQIVDPRVVQLNEVLSNVERLLARLIGEHIELRAIREPDLWPVKIDPLQCEQILVNLAVNARDAMPGGGRLTLRTENVTLPARPGETQVPALPSGDYVLLSVADTGSGMPEEVRQRAFEPFFTTKGPGQGTGLGLAMVYGAVSQHGGLVEIDSEVGQGTMVRVYLPALRGADTSTPAAATKSAEGGHETILLVEDERAVRDLARRVLERKGYRVLACADGSDAIARAGDHEGTIDLLLTDLVMPGMNGRDLATRLAEGRPRMKVLFTSGYSEDLVARHGVLMEGVAFLPKPYTPDVLARRVRDALER